MEILFVLQMTVKKDVYSTRGCKIGQIGLRARRKKAFYPPLLICLPPSFSLYRGFASYLSYAGGVMLKRTNPLPDRHARFRARVKAGVACALVEFDASVVDFFVKLPLT